MNTIKLNSIKPNPNNPRIITAEKLEDLKNSIKKYPNILDVRPIVIDNDFTVLGGNQRLLALKALGYKEVKKEWIVKADTLSEEEKKAFIIADNHNVGEWDYEELQLQFNTDELNDLGIKIPPLELNFEEVDHEKETKEKKENNLITCPYCGCELDLK